MNILVVFTGLSWISQFLDACDFEAQGVEDIYQDIIVNKHNELRAKVANGQQEGLPKASNMKQMVWDDAVAQKAQEWANKCEFAHDTKEDRDTGRGHTGQNLMKDLNQNTDPVWEKAIENWYNEVTEFNFDPTNIDKFDFQSEVGHFTQNIWANTDKVGCGYVRYKDGEHYVHLYGCNYLPGGNIVGMSIYKQGEPCSECGGCGSIPGLCQPDVNEDT